MNKFNRTLIALDLSAADQVILRYFAAMAGLLQASKLYVVHIMPNFSVPKNVEVEFHKLFSPKYPVDEKVGDKLSHDLEAYFGKEDKLEWSVEIIEGKPYEKLIHWTKVKGIDLLVVGNKEVSEGSGITAKRVARNSRCSVLFVPEKARTNIRRILVPVDFSDPSLQALQLAQQLAVRIPQAEVTSLYVVEMPPEDFYQGPLQNAGYRSILMESAQQAYQDFVGKNQIDPDLVRPAFVGNSLHNVARHITEFAAAKEVDLVVMGAQGHTAFEHFLYGSVTENVVARCRTAPVLVVR